MAKKQSPLAKFIRGRTGKGKAATARAQDRAYRRGQAVPAKAAERAAAREESPFRAAKKAAGRKPRGGATGGR